MRAVGIVRVSQVGGRAGESFASPVEQRERIEAACERDGLELIGVHQELDVSGGTPLGHREGLRSAVEAVEAGEAEVIVAAYFDRLVRSLRVQEELVSRVEAAGGRVLAVDVGAVSAKTSTQWVQSTFLGTMAEYQRRMAKERGAEAQARAVARGVAPWPNVPAGYRRNEDGVLVPTAQATAVRRAFEMRAGGERLVDVRTYLREQGIERSYHGVQAMLQSRVYLGEIHFGKLANLDAHGPIIDEALWRAVQETRLTRGRRASSERLLARLGVLRCGTCGARLVVGHQTSGGERYPFYRCVPTSDCPQRVTISATIAEDTITEAVREALADVEGRASAEQGARDAVALAERAQADLDAAIRAFAGVEDEPVALERLAELRGVRDEARAHAEKLGGLRSAVVIRADSDWERLTLDERRGLIRAVVARADVRPGRGSDRISVLLVEDSPGR